MAKIRDTKELAREMREYIETHGWVQGTPEDRTGAVCLASAMGHTIDRTSFEEMDLHRFIAAFVRVTGTIAVSRWNDAPERTYEDVILTLKQIEDGT